MNKKLVSLLISSLFVIAPTFKSAAQRVNSPYTFGSYGLLRDQSFMHHQLMGGLSSIVHNKGDFSMVNPASLYALEQTSLQTGIYGNLIDQKTATQSNSEFNGDLGYFALGLPLSLEKHIGLSIGLNQLTDVDYSIPGETTENGIPVTNVFRGHGGINQLQTGLGGQVAKGLSVGIGAAFLSGSIVEEFDKQFPENNEIFSLRNTSTTYFRGVKWNAGVQYNSQFKGGAELTIGLHGSPSTTVTASASQLLRTYNYNGNFFIDTVTSRKDNEEKRNLPLTYGGALSFGKADLWKVGVEYNVAGWSEITDLKNVNPFYDQTSFTIGGFFQLKKEMNSQHTGFGDRARDYLKTTRVYYGLRMQSLYTGVVSEQVSEMAVSLGLGLPLTRVYSIEGNKFTMVSRLNIGVEYLIRGNTENGLVQENVLGIKFGLTLNDKWFNKRKYQ